MMINQWFTKLVLLQFQLVAKALRQGRHFQHILQVLRRMSTDGSTDSHGATKGLRYSTRAINGIPSYTKEYQRGTRMHKRHRRKRYRLSALLPETSGRYGRLLRVVRRLVLHVLRLMRAVQGTRHVGRRRQAQGDLLQRCLGFGFGFGVGEGVQHDALQQ